jgi:hypothetical protein
MLMQQESAFLILLEDRSNSPLECVEPSLFAQFGFYSLTMKSFILVNMLLQNIQLSSSSSYSFFYIKPEVYRQSLASLNYRLVS